MEDQTNFQTGNAQTIQNAPHGNQESVPVRETGIGLNSNHPISATDDRLTEQRRAHYGDTEAFSILHTDTINSIRSDMNDVTLPNNPEVKEQIRGEWGFWNHTGAG